ncbi:unnamed protein product [Amoebophrya sp. A25]|nr:unnamed protein product [Amoebophrya sp. A25]|eukprot:GSA25T00025414001.1
MRLAGFFGPLSGVAVTGTRLLQQLHHLGKQEEREPVENQFQEPADSFLEDQDSLHDAETHIRRDLILTQRQQRQQRRRQRHQRGIEDLGNLVEASLSSSDENEQDDSFNTDKLEVSSTPEAQPNIHEEDGPSNRATIRDELSADSGFSDAASSLTDAETGQPLSSSLHTLSEIRGPDFRKSDEAVVSTHRDELEAKLLGEQVVGEPHLLEERLDEPPHPSSPRQNGLRAHFVETGSSGETPTGVNEAAHDPQEQRSSVVGPVLMESSRISEPSSELGAPSSTSEVAGAANAESDAKAKLDEQLHASAESLMKTNDEMSEIERKLHERQSSLKEQMEKKQKELRDMIEHPEKVIDRMRHKKTSKAEGEMMALESGNFRQDEPEEKAAPHQPPSQNAAAPSSAPSRPQQQHKLHPMGRGSGTTEQELEKGGVAARLLETKEQYDISSTTAATSEDKDKKEATTATEKKAIPVSVATFDKSKEGITQQHKSKKQDSSSTQKEQLAQQKKASSRKLQLEVVQDKERERQIEARKAMEREASAYHDKMEADALQMQSLEQKYVDDVGTWGQTTSREINDNIQRMRARQKKHMQHGIIPSSKADIEEDDEDFKNEYYENGMMLAKDVFGSSSTSSRGGSTSGAGSSGSPGSSASVGGGGGGGTSKHPQHSSHVAVLTRKVDVVVEEKDARTRNERSSDAASSSDQQEAHVGGLSSSSDTTSSHEQQAQADDAEVLDASAATKKTSTTKKMGFSVEMGQLHDEDETVVESSLNDHSEKAAVKKSKSASSSSKSSKKNDKTNKSYSKSRPSSHNMTDGENEDSVVALSTSASSGDAESDETSVVEAQAKLAKQFEEEREEHDKEVADLRKKLAEQDQRMTAMQRLLDLQNAQTHNILDETRQKVKEWTFHQGSSADGPSLLEGSSEGDGGMKRVQLSARAASGFDEPSHYDEEKYLERARSRKAQVEDGKTTRTASRQAAAGTTSSGADSDSVEDPFSLGSPSFSLAEKRRTNTAELQESTSSTSTSTSEQESTSTSTSTSRTSSSEDLKPMSRFFKFWEEHEKDQDPHDKLDGKFIDHSAEWDGFGSDPHRAANRQREMTRKNREPSQTAGSMPDHSHENGGVYLHHTGSVEHGWDDVGGHYHKRETTYPSGRRGGHQSDHATWLEEEEAADFLPTGDDYNLSDYDDDEDLGWDSHGLGSYGDFYTPTDYGDAFAAAHVGF